MGQFLPKSKFTKIIHAYNKLLFEWLLFVGRKEHLTAAGKARPTKVFTFTF
jgi:hypothetical protein